MAELADGVLLSRSGMTRLVNRLEREGLLERDACVSDGRGTFAVLTPKGEALLSRARRTHLDDVRDRFLKHFTDDELEQLARLWNRVLPGAADIGAERPERQPRWVGGGQAGAAVFDEASCPSGRESDP